MFCYQSDSFRSSDLSTAFAIFVGRWGLSRKFVVTTPLILWTPSYSLNKGTILLTLDGPVDGALQEMDVEWNFIPPYSLQLGGLWEAGVKSCKYYLKCVMGNTLFTFEELSIWSKWKSQLKTFIIFVIRPARPAIVYPWSLFYRRAINGHF